MLRCHQKKFDRKLTLQNDQQLQNKTFKTVAHSSENTKFDTTQELFKIVAYILENNKFNTI